MKIIAFGASPSKNSINKKLATYAHLFENAKEVLDLNDFKCRYLRLISKKKLSTRVSKSI
jgi:NAD(P)H-dependent FMN reductase